MREPSHAIFNVAYRDHDSVTGQVVEQRRGRVKEQRQVIFNPREGDAVANVAVGQRPRRVTFEYFPELRAEVIARGFVHRELTPRQQLHFADRVQTALGIDVKRTDRLDLVIEQVDAIRNRRPHGKQVDQAATHAKFTGYGNLRHMGIVGQCELLA